MSRKLRSAFDTEDQYLVSVDFGGSNTRVLSGVRKAGFREIEDFNMVTRWPGEKHVKTHVPVVVAVDKQNEAKKFWGWEAEKIRKSQPDQVVIYTNLKRLLGPDARIHEEDDSNNDELDPDSIYSVFHLARMQDLKTAQKYGHDLASIALYYIQNLIEYVCKPGKDTHAQVITITVPAHWGEGASKLYAGNIQACLPDRAACRVEDEPRAGIIGIIDDLRKDKYSLLSPGKPYVEVDTGSTTTVSCTRSSRFRGLTCAGCRRGLFGVS